MTLNLLDRYSEFVAALASPNSTASEKDKLTVASLGLSGECGECLSLVHYYFYTSDVLDETKLIDEIGDVIWYFMFATQSLNEKMIDLTKFDYETCYSADANLNKRLNILDLVIQLNIQSANFTDLVKKEIYHGKSYPKEKFLSKLELIIELINNLCGCLNFTVGNVIRLNIKKLESRYPSGKFSVEDFIRKENAKDPE
jgi:NTP pyrophosphatase (non-canonical NTP hydrolase)